MTESIADQRQVTTTIQGISQKTGSKGPYQVLETVPRPGMVFPDTYKVWDNKLMEGLKVGDTVTLTLQRGKPRIANPSNPLKDWWWETVGITKVAPDQFQPSSTTSSEAPKKPAPAPETPKTINGREEAIARAVALKAAVEFIVQSQQAEAVDAVLEVAERFREWLLR